MDTTSVYEEHVDALVASAQFQRLEDGRFSSSEYDRFVLNVVRTHAKSPQLLAFLFALAPPAATANVRANMLEELGLADGHADAHPALLEQLLLGAGLGDHLAECCAHAEADMRQLVTAPLIFESLAQLGLSASIEVTAFEYMLAHVADRIATALATYRGLSSHALEWFTHHGEVDVAHAEAGVLNIDRYVDYYEIEKDDATTILEVTTRENIFIKRYFTDVTPGQSAGCSR